MKIGMKILMILTAVFAILTLSACSSEAMVPGFDVSVRPADSAKNDDATAQSPSDNSSSGNNSSGNNSSDNSSSGNNSSGNSSSDILSLLTPSGAKLESVDESSARMSSLKSFEELIAFYQNALKELGAIMDSTQNHGDSWNYNGSYNNGEYIGLSIEKNYGGTGCTIFVNVYLGSY